MISGTNDDNKNTIDQMWLNQEFKVSFMCASDYTWEQDIIPDSVCHAFATLTNICCIVYVLDFLSSNITIVIFRRLLDRADLILIEKL